MKNLKYIKIIGIGLSLLLLGACEDFLEIEEPNTMILSSEVFKNDETAITAMQGIYNQLCQASFSAGWLGSVSVVCELSSDNLKPIHDDDFIMTEFQEHDLLADNSYNAGLWSGAYNIIYMTNAMLEGLAKATQISPEVANRLEGETRFVRAFTYFYLVNLYGEVPLVLTTDYKINAVVKKNPKPDIYQQILEDLEISMELLNAEYIAGERTHVNRYAAVALLARVHLYLEDWVLAETYSSEVIAQSAQYTLINDLDQVFLANSQEAIWQLSPLGGGGLTNTKEGSAFIPHPRFSSLSYVKLSEGFVNSLEATDKRRAHWINYHEELDIYYAFKYKIQNSMETVTEYSMIFRLAEQYLIRAEARAQQNNLSGAIADLDKIRERAGLTLLSVTNPGIAKDPLLKEILKERRHELFTEWGHRWFDLIRTGEAEEILGPESPGWSSTDIHYPIPEDELIKNPNLSQNPGY